MPIPKPAWLTPWRAAVFIFLLSFFIRLAILVLVVTPHPVKEENELGRIATEIALNHQFANPYVTPTGPTAHGAPLYPFIQSLWIVQFGDTATAGTCAAILNIVFSAIAAALMPALAAQCRIPLSVGILAGLFQAAVPVSALRELSFFESTFLAMLLVIASLITIRIFTDASFSARSALGYGVFWGVVLLASPVTVLVFWGILLVGFHFFFQRRRNRSFAVFAFIAIVSAGVTLAPWTVRNYLTFGGLFLVRDDFGLELKVSNNSAATPLMDDNISLSYFQKMHPFFSAEEAQLVRSLGEREYNRRALGSGIRWIEDHPTQFLNLSARRFTIFWFMLGWPPWKGVVLIPMVLLGVAGCIGMIRRHPVAGWTIACIPVLFPLVYYVVQTSSRYRFPAYWTVSFFAFYALVTYFRPEESYDAHVLGRIGDNARSAKVT
jgi:hypothetical protein